MNNSPEITVLMPVYNGEMFLKDSIESILNQTFRDFELLIIDDASTDNSVKIIESYNDNRIKLFKNTNNSGLSVTRNKGFDLAKGKYIVLADCDDISLIDRLEKQLLFMESHLEIGICGSWIKKFGKRRAHIWKYSPYSNELKAGLLFNSCFAQPSVIIRKSLITSNNLYYSESFLSAEDYDLWSRASKYTSFSNNQEILLMYRCHNMQESILKGKIQDECAKSIHYSLINELEIQPSELELEIHEQICYLKPKNNIEDLQIAENWLLKLKSANDNLKIYDVEALCNILGGKWFAYCKKSKKLGFKRWNLFISSPLYKFVKINKLKLFLFWLSCFI